ncbi:MAG: hypothetical protein PVG07_14220 [Acidobacteriota bacterium]|jgi:hypothetical protein
MSTRPREQPFRASLLCHLEPKVRRPIEEFGSILESVLLDALPAPLTEPFNLVRARATAEDLDALLLHAREAVGSWESSRGETSEDLRRAMVEALASLEHAHDVLVPAIEAETEGDDGAR